MSEKKEDPIVVIEDGKIKLVDFTKTHMGYQYERRFLGLYGDYIQKDLLRWCIYSISLNDPAHQLGHVFDVCVRAKEIFEHFEEIEGLTDLDRRIVYHAALMHDLGCRFNRADHHIIGYGLVYEYINRYCPGMYGPDILRQIAVCVLEHRSSNKRKPTTLLSEIISVADTSVPDIDVYFKRALQFRISGVEESYGSDEEIITSCIEHIQDKFGDDGYHWKSYPDIGLAYYGDEWDAFKAVLKDESACRSRLSSILKEIKE